MKKFFGEFKKFISRGNVLDMAVGVIVGSAFTAIVNGLSDHVLKPIINWLLALCLGKGTLSEVYTFLGAPAYTVDAEGNRIVDLANSFYIDWGSLINAIINFLIIAFVLFSIVKIINRVQEQNDKFGALLKKNKLSKENRAELKKRGIKRTDAEAVKAYLEEKKTLEEKAAEEAKKAEEEKALKERLANPTAEDLLKDIKALLEKQIAEK